MSPQILGPLRPVALLGVALISIAGGGLTIHGARANECLTAPTGKTPQGSHWYFHTDRVHHRKCWFLRGSGATQQSAKAAADVQPSATASNAHSAAADSCLSAPKGPAPKGEHWFYHRDHATGHKCWHLAAADEAAQPKPATSHADAAPAPEAAAAPAPQPADKPAASAESAPPAPQKQPSDAAWSKAPSGAQLERIAGAHNSEQQKIPDLGAAPAATAPAAAASPQPATASVAPQPIPQPAETTSAAEPDQADQPALADAAAAAPSGLLSSGGHPAADPSPADPPPSGTSVDPASASDTAARASQNDPAPASPPAKQAAASGTTPLSVLLIVALALGLTAVLYRVGLKLLEMRPPRVVIDRSGQDWSEPRYDEASMVPQQMADMSPPSIVPVTAELDLPHPIGREWPRDGLGSRIVQRRAPHEDRLNDLLRDLDNLLKARKQS